MKASSQRRAAADLLLLVAHAQHVRPLDAASSRPGEHRLCESDLTFHQMLVGRDIARASDAKNALQAQVFRFGEQMQNLVYLVGDPDAGECVAIDAAYDPDGVVAASEAIGCNVTAFVATHFHYDHIGSSRDSDVQPTAPEPYRELPGLRTWLELGVPKAYIHHSEVSLAARQIGVAESKLTPLSEGQVIQIGRVSLRVLHTPGHSPGSVVLVVSVGGVERLVITADTLFPGSCGRLDLPGSSVHAMWSSMRKLSKLDAALPIFPGHAYSGEESTIGQEKRTGLLRSDITLSAWRQHFARSSS